MSIVLVIYWRVMQMILAGLEYLDAGLLPQSRAALLPYPVA